MENNLFFQSILNTFQTTLNSQEFFKIISSLSEIILLILIFSWILKKISVFRFNHSISYMKIIDRLSIGSQQSIIIVEVEKVRLVLGITAKNITHLYTYPSILKNTLISKEADDTLCQKSFFNRYLKKFSKISWKKTMFYRIIPFLFLLFFCPTVCAEIPGLTSHLLDDGGQTWSVPVQTLVFLTSLTFLSGISANDD